MSWGDVFPLIKFWDENSGASWGSFGGTNSFQEFDIGYVREIYQILADLYFGSPEAARLLDGAAARGQEIRLYQTLDTISGNTTSAGAVGINFTAISNEYLFNRNGYFVRDDPHMALIHELFHALAGTDDLVPDDPTEAQLNSPYFDYDGETVKKEQIVATEMGRPDLYRVSYLASMYTNDPRYDLVRQGISYSDGNVVDIVRFGDEPSGATSNLLHLDHMDLSNRTWRSNDLVFGFVGNDTIITGTGNDYIYGGPGDDCLSGGSGDNFIDGGDRVTPIAQDGIDTVDYSIGDFDLPPRQWGHRRDRSKQVQNDRWEQDHRCQ
jgi:Ca2+-binding RTX toxin-like protein